MSETYRFWSRYTRQYLYEPKSKARTLSFFSVVLILLLIVIGIVPQFEELLDKIQQIKERRAAIQKINDRLKIAEDVEVAYEEALTYSDILDRKIPKDSALGNFVEEISGLASSNLFALSYLSPQAEAQKSFGNVRESIVIMDLEGDINNILKLVKDIEDFERFIGIRSLTVQQPTSGVGKARLELVVYSYR